MKKFIAMLLSLILIVGLMGGCSSAESDKPVLKVAMSPDFSPMEFVDPTKTGQDKFVGFDVSLAKYIADELGMTLEIMPMDFDACQAAVASGKVDMSISGYSWTIYNAGLAEGNPADFGIPTLDEYNWETVKATLK